MRRKKISDISNRAGQTLPTVLIMAAILSIFAVSLVTLFKYESKFLVLNNDIATRREIASIALEHAIAKLQQGSNWQDAGDSTGMTWFVYDQEYTTTGGTYKINIVGGNLFINTQTTWHWWTGSTTTVQRQGQDDFRTIGIKVKSGFNGMEHCYYAVVRKGYGGPLISKGTINLPCPQTNFSTNRDSLDFYWGDVYSANPAHDACRIPFIKVGEGNNNPQAWMPEVYAAGDIYTATNYNGDPNQQSSITSYTYDYTTDDMAPNAHCHPFSPFAKAPDVDLDYYRKMASANNSYYGPATITGQPNPFYWNEYDPNNPTSHDLSTLTAINVYAKIVSYCADSNDCVFIDTTDGLPVRPPSGSTPANTYCGTTAVPATQLTSPPQAIEIYADDNNQYYTRGYLLVMGPLILIGDDPDSCSHGWGWYGGCPADVTRVTIPSNYYYPQDTNNGSGRNHLGGSGWTWWGIRTYYTLNDVKHAGFLYTNGELRIGGKRVGTNPPYSDICIYGTIYLDTYGSLTMDETNDNPQLWVYFDTDRNLFDYMGNNIILLTFGDWSWLVPTPGPY